MDDPADRFPLPFVARRAVEGVTVETYAAPDLVTVVPPRFEDRRGFLAETYSRRRYAALGIDVDFVQENHTYSAAAGTVRGLHFQMPPHAQGKLVRVVRGAVLDVAVDLRHGSPAFGRAIAVPLSAATGRQIYVPPGFAHGFCTLVPDTEVLYRMSAYYVPDAQRGIAWDDPALAIAWPVDPAAAVLSDKDRKHPALDELGPLFRYRPAP